MRNKRKKLSLDERIDEVLDRYDGLTPIEQMDFIMLLMELRVDYTTQKLCKNCKSRNRPAKEKYVILDLDTSRLESITWNDNEDVLVLEAL